MSPFQNIKRILQINKDTTRVVLVYIVAIALLSLIVPISVQSLINIVSFGTVLQPIVALTIVLFIVLSLVAGLRIAQAIVVETIQQNIFATISIRLVENIPRLKVVCFDRRQMLTASNLFFEIQTIQKSLAVLLVNGIEIFLLAFFGMVLIAFYHPILLVFDIILLILLTIALAWPWKQAVIYAIKECEAKHHVAEWIEEVTINVVLFKLTDKSSKALNKVDSRIIQYLQHRKKHFSSLLRHIISINIIYVFANSALLGIGGYLVVQEQLSLGQLVASELLVNAFLYGFVRFSYYLEDLYDLIASSIKLNSLTDMEKESQIGFEPQTNNHMHYQQGINFTVDNLTFSTTETYETHLPLSFKANTNEALIFYKSHGRLASLILDTLIGLRSDYQGSIIINDLPIKDSYMTQLRENTMLLRRGETFSGSLRENLLLGLESASNEQIYKLFERYHLSELVHQLPHGLKTDMLTVRARISDTDLLKISWIRALLHQPKLLLIDYYIDYFFNSDFSSAIQDITDYSGTIIITTKREQVVEHFSNRIML